MLTNCLAACAHLTITLSEIQRDVKKMSFYHTPLHSTPPLGGGGSRRNIGTPFGMEKLEWCRYSKVKKISKMCYSFWRDPRTCQTDRQTDGRTDGRTLHDSTDRACIASRGKKTVSVLQYSVLL